MARSDRARRHRVPRQAVHAQQFALRVSAEPRDSCVQQGRYPPSEGTIAEEAFSRLSRGTLASQKGNAPNLAELSGAGCRAERRLCGELRYVECTGLAAGLGRATRTP